ncbi:winged helix-turn-helix domain-containing protein [Mesorhizobium sp. M0522]|uniref:winged helix-turn-helix domain-containing protein n=1 Tax=Mesorhizobium sp. M0522 TaxID=2956958 RepID=UPI00333CC8C4
MTTLQSDAAAKGVWISISDLAKRKNISRQSAKERVDRLVSKGLIETRPEGRSRMIDLAAYDRAVGEVGDAYRETSAETKKEPAPAHKPLRDAQTERAQYEARLKALDLAERQGKILPIKGDHGIENALTIAGVIIAREIDRFMTVVDDIAVAVAKEGVIGAKRVMKEAIRERRARVAEALAEVIAKGQAAERDGPISTDVGSDLDD